MGFSGAGAASPEDDADLAQAGQHAPEQLGLLGARAAVDVAVHRGHLQLLDVVRLGPVPEGSHADAGDGERAPHGHREVVGEDGGMRPCRYVRATTSRQIAPASTVIVRAFSSTARIAVHGLHVQQDPAPADGELRLRVGGPARGHGEAVARAKSRAWPTSSADVGFTTSRGRQLMDVPEVGQELVVGLCAGEDDALDRGPQVVELRRARGLLRSPASQWAARPPLRRAGGHGQAPGSGPPPRATVSRRPCSTRPS